MKYLKNILKILISAGLLGYLIYKADPKNILNVFSGVGQAHGFFYLSLAIFFQLLSLFIMAMRWQKLLQGYGYNLRLRNLSSYYLIGLFFNNFLPTSIGGDVVRIYSVVDETGDRTSGFASVIIERIIGIAATLSLAILALFFISQQFLSQRLMWITILLFLAIIFFFIFIILKKPFELLVRIFGKLAIFKIGEKLNKLFEAIHFFKARRRILLYVFLYSLASQVTIILMNYSLVRAFNLQVDLMYLFLVVPVTFVMTILPSINGVGLRDLGFVSLLARVGVTDAAALSLSFMNLFIPMLISISGAVLFVVHKRKSNKGDYNVFETSL